MAADYEGNDEAVNGAIDELLTLQGEALHRPVCELAEDVTTKLNELAHALNAFNEMVAAEPCSCGCTPVGIQAVIVEAAKLAITVAIYSLAIGQRNPGGFHIGIGPKSANADLN